MECRVRVGLCNARHREHRRLYGFGAPPLYLLLEQEEREATELHAGQSLCAQLLALAMIQY